jgi:hypothetical protein
LRLQVLLAASALCIYPLSAQTSKTLDLRTQHSKDSFYVVLASRGGSATGHAFVVWGVEDSRRRRTTVRAEGLYPEGSSTSCSSQVRTVPGGMLDELKTHSFQSIDQELIVRVDESVYKRSWQVARQWDCRHEYSLFSRDCVEFLRAVGLSLGLDMPRRGIARWTPHAYVRALLARAGEGSLFRPAKLESLADGQ